MKKVLFSMLVALLSVVAISCSCNRDKEIQKLNVEEITAADHQYMIDSISSDYKWLECCVDLKYFIDTDAANYAVAVSNIFEVMNVDSLGIIHGCKVYLFTHTIDTNTLEVKDGLWVGDDPMSRDTIKICFAEAYERMMKSNCLKPHSRHCVLRKEVGPVDTVPQYIFGNPRCQVYVDVITGNADNHNPCFPIKDNYEMKGAYLKDTL